MTPFSLSDVHICRSRLFKRFRSSQVINLTRACPEILRSDGKSHGMRNIVSQRIIVTSPSRLNIGFSFVKRRTKLRWNHEHMRMSNSLDFAFSMDGRHFIPCYEKIRSQNIDGPRVREKITRIHLNRLATLKTVLVTHKTFLLVVEGVNER